MHNASRLNNQPRGALGTRGIYFASLLPDEIYDHSGDIICAALVRRIGILASRGWAQHIVDRWRVAVTNRPAAFHTTEIVIAADELLSDNPHRGGYHGMHVPGA